jgi:hypothetical protein
MSKNFELLMEIEKDFGSAIPEPDRKPERAAIPVPTLAALDVSEVDYEVARLVKRIFLPATGAPHRQVVFCGIEADSASSSVCARAARNLAARTLERVCLVDANPSPDGLTCLFGIPANASSRMDYEQCLSVAGNLWLTRCGGMNGNGEQSSELRERLIELQRDFGYVLIDAPGCAVNDEAIVLGQASDAVILVIEAEATRRVAASKAKQTLEAGGVRLAGTVLHNRSFPIPKALYKRL